MHSRFPSRNPLKLTNLVTEDSRHTSHMVRGPGARPPGGRIPAGSQCFSHPLTRQREPSFSALLGQLAFHYVLYSKGLARSQVAMVNSITLSSWITGNKLGVRLSMACKDEQTALGW